jgi:hypothetical protein
VFSEAGGQARVELADHLRDAAARGPEYIDALLRESVDGVTHRPVGMHPRIAELVREIVRDAQFVGTRAA